MCLLPKTPSVRSAACAVPYAFQHRRHRPELGSCPVCGPLQSLHCGTGLGSEQNLALPPHTRPHVRTCWFLGWNDLPQTTQILSAMTDCSDRKAMPYTPLCFCGTTASPDASTFMTISGSNVVNRAEAACPSPSHTPSTYGGIGRSALGISIADWMGTAWLGRRSTVGQYSVAAICSVVTTCGSTGSA